MQEVQGDAAFDSFPDERFRFGVGHTEGTETIWLESQKDKKRWTCQVADVTSFAPADVVLPQQTVLHYVAASLKNSAIDGGTANRGPKLVRGEADKTLQLEVLIKLGVADFAWAPKYVFPLTLTSPMSPAEAQAKQITLLTTQVQEIQREVQMLKKQLQTVLQTSAAASQPAAAPVTTCAPLLVSTDLCPAPVPVEATTDSTGGQAPATPSRGAQVWGDIIGHPQHKLVQTDEIRETRNALGVTIRSHRQHTCKVCSLLRGTRSRASGTSYYCPACTERHNGGMVYLCDKTRPHDPSKYRNASCTQIWHLMWDNGKSIPQTGTASIRMRKKRKESDPSQSETIPSTGSAKSSVDARS